MTTMLFRGAIALGFLTTCFAQFFPGEFVTDSPMSTMMPSPTTDGASKQKPATYWITYSKTVRPGHPMVFQVQIFQGSSPVDVMINLKDSRDNILISHGPVSVMPRVPTAITVDIPLNLSPPGDGDRWSWGWQNYKVQVSGRGLEMTFKDEGQASYQEKAFSIFVQTDKAMYKPSQKVQFRTLAMTPDMKVMRDVQQDIVVFDSKGNKILQFKGITASQTLGVVEKSFTLASSVPTGNWKIKVTIEGLEEEKEFEVSDYVLPKFEVEVDAPSFGLNSAVFYEFTVKATYTFGKPVTDGDAKVAIIPTHNYYRTEAERPRWTTKGKLNQNGELKVQVMVEDLRQLGQSRYNIVKTIPQWWNFEIEANVTERRTGKTHSGEHGFVFYDSPIDIQILGITPGSFKSGLDYTAYIEVKKRDGSMFSPLELKEMRVRMSVSYNVPVSKPATTTEPLPQPTPGSGFAEGGRLEMTHADYYYPREEKRELTLENSLYTIPETGWIIVTFRVPDEATGLELKARTESPFEDKDVSKWVTKSNSPTNSFLQLSVLNKKPRVGDTIQVQAKATEAMKLLNYQVFSKGLMIASSEVSGPSRNLDFQFVATKSMSPSMSIVAFYVRDDGEFVVDALSLSVNGLFDNAVQVEFSKEKVKPGEALNLIVRGESDSLVFFLVVDKSVKLLKSGNDITQDMVVEELSKYDYGNYGNWRYMFICGWPSYFGGEDARSVFDNAGLVVLTDGLIYSRYNSDLGPWMPRIWSITAGAGYRTIDANSNGRASRAKRTRKLFPETWLWNIAPIYGTSGQVVVPLTSPDTITSWLASVFSVHPQSGLSVAERPAEVITFRDMFVSLDLPSFIVRGEDFCFKASVFSYYPGNIPVLLTLEPNDGFTNIVASKTENNEVVITNAQYYYSHFMGFLSENDIKTETFCFTPVKIGYITIHVSALTDIDGLSDAVERKLRVKPEGFPHSTTVSQLVTPVSGYWSQDIPVQFPEDVVPGSQRISVNIAGNLLGPIFDNLEDLLQKPYGCGEQNMINFSPIMSLVDFFYTTNTITEEFRQKAVDYMLIGYQKEILYEHEMTGGYSTFGNQDNPKEVASTWLTAFVTKCFSQAEILDTKYQNILAMDVDLIFRSANWMVNRGTQQRDGRFVENGKVFNKGLQGGSSAGVALTSYTVISLHHALKVLKINPEFQYQQIEKGLEKAIMFLEENVPFLTDEYDVCITTYALTLVGSSLQDMAFAKMERMAKKGFGMTYWERPKQEEENNYYYWSRGTDAINIEMTSYALLTYALMGKGTTDGLPIVRWLSKQKGPNGGFISTQDTVIGIEALTSVAKELYGAQFVPMTITVNTKNNISVQGTYSFQVNKENEMLLQRNDIPYEAGNDIEIIAQSDILQDSSKTTVLVDVVMNYNVFTESRSSAYRMSHELENIVDGFNLWINISTADGKPASMSILEVDVPAGYEHDVEEIKKQSSYDLIDRIDTTEDRVNLYFNTDVISGEVITLKLTMIHTGGTLITSKGKTYKISNYYEPGMELEKEYFLTDDRSFCTKMPTYGVCQYL